MELIIEQTETVKSIEIEAQHTCLILNHIQFYAHATSTFILNKLLSVWKGETNIF